MKLHPTGVVLLAGTVSLGWVALSACDRQAPGAVAPHGAVPAAQDSAAQAAQATRTSGILQRVRRIVVDHLGVDPRKVTENARFIGDLGADSLDTVELTMAFEEEFNVIIPDDVAEHIETVGDAVRVIEGCKPYSITDTKNC